MIVKIRRATAADNPAIAAIYNDAVRTGIATFDTEPRSPAGQRQWLARHDRRHPVLVAVVKGRVVGWASLSPWSDRKAYDGTAEVSFYLQAEHRGHGIGRKLLTELVARSKPAGLHVLLARIAQPNVVSVHLHESLGFERIGEMREVGRKFNQWIDVHLFERMVPTSAGAAESGTGSRRSTGEGS
ncbi:MAG: N-acetyltransferase family protein [Thermoplasmata archaeon]|nr:N-acetyltransferase family protein [Thermoplasmata archaeon]